MKMQTSLADRLKHQIEADGPLSIADYMAQCLCDPDGGYYTTANPFGETGDFTTAPEISQMFGELIGIWCVTMWRNLGAPPRFNLVEMGPGRGTLMADLLRAASVDQEFYNAAEVSMLEISKRLQAKQQKTLEKHLTKITWIDTLDQIENIPTIFIGNEFLDALPCRQYVKADGNWHEQMVGLQDEKLAYFAGTGLFDPALLPDDHKVQKEGTIFEAAPAREAVASNIAAHIAQYGGAALLIDYGHLTAGFGDTFQAVAAHEFADPLENPGAADLTSHVDFAALANAISAHSDLSVNSETQADFLLNMGLLERVGILGHNKSPAEQSALQETVERLVGPDAMGELFKAFAIAPKGISLAGF